MATIPIERNSRLSLANAKNKAAQNYLTMELGFLEKEKKTALRMLQNEKRAFRSKYSKMNLFEEKNSFIEVSHKLNHTEDKLKEGNNLAFGDINGIGNMNSINFEQVHNLLFTNDEIDIEKILCLHLVSAHRTESLSPPKKKLLAHMCKIHSPVEKLLERSKRKNIHHEQKLTSMLPIYTIESMEFGATSPRDKDLINDGRLAARILLNERIREVINTVLTALKQSNPEKNYVIFEKANDVSCLKKMFASRKILDFLDELNECPFIYSCDSFILTAPFRAKSIQLEIRTISGSLEYLVKKIRQNVLQIPTRQTRPDELEEENEVLVKERPPFSFGIRSKMNKITKGNTLLEDIELLYSDKTDKFLQSSERKVVRHKDKNFIRQNIKGLANVKRIEYDPEEEDEFFFHKKIFAKNPIRYRRSTTIQRRNVVDRPNIQPIDLPVVVLMSDKDKDDDGDEDDSPKNSPRASFDKMSRISVSEEKSPEISRISNRIDRRRSSTTDSGKIRIHLKQTTCPACMEKYKIPLPTPKTPRVKPSTVLPIILGESTVLRTNSKNRLSMLINKETFKLESYERRFSSADERTRRKNFNKKEMESISTDEFNLSPLELAKIEQEIKEKETQKKLEKFLNS